MKFKDGIKEKNIIVKCGADKFLPFAITFGLYVILFGTVSPGGGFQGGVIVASAAIMIYLGNGFHIVSRALRSETLRVGEALGASLYVFLGLLGIIGGANFCRNIFFDNGEVGDLISAGTITYMSYAVGFKVLTGVGFLLLLLLGILAPDPEPAKPAVAETKEQIEVKETLNETLQTEQKEKEAVS
ncbi:MAG: MnhB domain-containing protein [Lachnospiraceae bacterium]|nr:MnhB domain-containing protein [Lachnospiraceae bacterium]